MKVVLLAGGFGTRISEESYLKPKPMIEIGEKPILWHIMKLYSYYGFNEFIICAGYKQHIIKEWFSNYFMYNSDITFDFINNETIIHHNYCDSWKVTVIDTGLYTMTGGRIKKIKQYLKDEPFFMTYGDGVSDVNILELLKFYKEQKKMAVLTAIQPDGRFGTIGLEKSQIVSFREKSRKDVGWINAGFMVLDPKVIDYIEDDSIIFEKEPLELLASEGELMCYKHEGFWQCMDTLRDKEKLEELWNSKNAPWKKWMD